MKCPKCQTENVEARNFCRECGAKLSIVCPQCKFENLPGDKFCGGCGHNLTLPLEPSPKDLSQDEKIEKIQRYLPKGIAEKILAQRDKIEGERKQVTVMFCDMKGFTSFSEKIDPEEVYSIMDQVYEILIHRVRDYEGTVNEMTGDGIMALFGAPVAHEDHFQRACHAALSIQSTLKKYSQGLGERFGIDFKLRVGLNSGPVVVGAIGDDLRMDYTAIGDTTNLAARMEGMARPGTVLVASYTHKLAMDFFELSLWAKFR